MMHIHRIGDVTVLNDFAPVPAMGGAPPLFLPVNAFVLHAEQPVVIDSGLTNADEDFVSTLAEVIDPADGYGSHIRTATTPAVFGNSSRPRREPDW